MSHAQGDLEASRIISGWVGELHLQQRQVHLIVEKQLDSSVVWKNIGVCPSMKRGLEPCFRVLECEAAPFVFIVSSVFLSHRNTRVSVALEKAGSSKLRTGFPVSQY